MLPREVPKPILVPRPRGSTQEVASPLQPPPSSSSCPYQASSSSFLPDPAISPALSAPPPAYSTLGPHPAPQGLAEASASAHAPGEPLRGKTAMSPPQGRHSLWWEGPSLGRIQECLAASSQSCPAAPGVCVVAGGDEAGWIGGCGNCLETPKPASPRVPPLVLPQEHFALPTPSAAKSSYPLISQAKLGF